MANAAIDFSKMTVSAVAVVTDRIIELTDCKPYLIQKLCIATVKRLHEQGRRRITLADVNAIGRPEEAG